LKVHLTSLPESERGDQSSRSKGWLFLVADGVGGVPGGQQASGTALRAIADYVTDAMDLYAQSGPEVEPGLLEELRHSVEKSHEVVLAEAEREHGHRGMATTLTMVMARWPRAYLVHVGDSRCYRLRAGKLELLTRDQTLAQALVDAGALAPERKEESALKHVLWSAVGGSEAKIEVSAEDLKWDDVMLLCSDGLTKHVTDEEIRQALMSDDSAPAICQGLVGLANDRGGSDNVTVVVARLRREPG
ncbi:MAG: PP2C family protein-serine/threonine phosphatase, partial [Gemmatimonadales bacterium]